MHLTLNSAAAKEQLSGIRQFTYLVKDTPGAIGFTLGEPDLATPEAIKAEVKTALDADETHYPPGNGFPATLQAISDFEAAEHGLHYSPEEIILTDGATEALFITLATILNPDDEVIIPTPAFGLYESIVRLFRGRPVFLPTENNGFQIDAQALQAAITPRTKALVLTSPNNPTGCIYTKDTLDAVHDLLADKPIFVLCDDVYRSLVYSGEYHSFAEYQDMRDRIVVAQSFSKPYAMTGWRLGYILADAPIRERLQVFHQYCVTSAPSVFQRACVQALKTDVTPVRTLFKKRRDYVYGRLLAMGFDIPLPEGAFYLFIPTGRFDADSQRFCKRLLAEAGVGFIPGVFFGTEGYMRMSYCYSDQELKEGLDRLENWINAQR